MTTPTPRDTGPALDPRAVEAAAEALDGLFYGTSSGARRAATVALTAAAPFLRAEGAAAERQRIAAAIRAGARPDATYLSDHSRAYLGGWNDATDAAARIAEAGPGTTAPTEEDDRD